MNIVATNDSVEITVPEKVTTGSYNVIKCSFDLSAELLSCDVIMANFKPLNGDAVQEVAIDKSKLTCEIPCFSTPCKVRIGIYCYDESSGSLSLRYSPSGAVFEVTQGSYADGAETPATPSAGTYAELKGEISDGLKLKEDLSNKTTEITVDSTDVQYPSAAAVYKKEVAAQNEALKAYAFQFSKSTVPLKDNCIVVGKSFPTSSGSVTDSGVLITSVEKNTNKILALSSSATDAQYPSAKAVYTAIENAKANIEGDLDSVSALIGGAS